MKLQSISPATGVAFAVYEEHSDAAVRATFQNALEFQRVWRTETFEDRARVIQRASKILLRDRTALAELVTREMGKPIRQARSEIDKCAACCDHYAKSAASYLEAEAIVTEASHSYVLYQPLGVLLAIMPWNFPFWQAIRAAAPALMAGNVMVLKHSSNVCGCALAIESVFREAAAGVPLLSTLLVSSRRAGRLVTDPAVAAVTLTGSADAGAAVAAAAASGLKKTVLELGGSDPYLILEDADLEHAAEACVTSRLINSGQSCIAAKRFIVMEKIREPFEKLCVEKMRARIVGDPFDEKTDVGPLARTDLRDTLHAQVEQALRSGARMLLGGEPPSGPGAYYPPTVLSDLSPGARFLEEEVFGPVAGILAARSVDEAVTLANATSFGLGAAVFTGNPRAGEEVARRLETGLCFINDYVRSDARLPFGGIKNSGYGRELGVQGIREFVNARSIWVK